MQHNGKQSVLDGRHRFLEEGLTRVCSVICAESSGKLWYPTAFTYMRGENDEYATWEFGLLTVYLALRKS